MKTKKHERSFPSQIIAGLKTMDASRLQQPLNGVSFEPSTGIFPVQQPIVPHFASSFDNKSELYGFQSLSIGCWRDEV